jgi:hypothetical protein
MKSKRISILFLVISSFLIGCTNQVEIPTATPVPQLTATQFFTASPLSTNTPLTKTLPIITPIYTIAPTPSLGSGWFQIPELPSTESISPRVAKSFVGIKVPPFPDGIVEEIRAGELIGEAPPSTIVHVVFIVRQGNARMLWIGALSEWSDTDGNYVRIFDSIPLPATQEGDMLIAFSCGRNNEVEPPLIVIKADNKHSEPDTSIRYAWRIDPEAITLKRVLYRDIKCWEW